MAPRVAVCDDDEDFRELAAAAVRADRELELVAVAPSVEGLLNALPAITVDVVLLDWLMPGFDQQDEAVRHVRAALPDATIIVLTAVLKTAAERRARAAGADAFVEKGPGATELIARCKAFL
jgi:DNA-binding NarL/FixJ family response regulator